MGSNMQRQAVPLAAGGAAGRHRDGARGGARLGRRDRRQAPGVVEYVAADRVVVRAEGRSKADPVQDLPLEIFNLTKYRRSNQNTCINQKPIVRRASGSSRATSSPTGRAPTRASWRSGATCSSPSCRGAATTSRTRSWSPSGSSRTIASPRSTSRSSRSRRDTKLRQGRGDARHPERLRGSPQGPRRVGHRADRREGQAGRHPGRQDHAEGRDPAHAGREACARSSARRPATCATPRSRCRRVSRARWST